MNFINEIKEIAKGKKKSVVFPEGFEDRTLKASIEVKKQNIASNVFLLGNKAEIENKASSLNLSLSGIEIIDPNIENEAYIQAYFKLREKKGMTIEKATIEMKDFLKYGAMMTRLQDVDSLVAGAHSTTGDVLRAGFTIIGTDGTVKSASSCFVMILENQPGNKYGAEGKFIFSDCATIPNPSAEQLAEIAISSAQSCRNFLKTEPIVALLSFSTKGSASTIETDKVIKAYEIIKQKEPSLQIDGELQLDAAIVEDIARSKAPNSTVAGKANTLIFPDLQSGNIGYKLVQRLAGAQAMGPILQGFAKPISDLSRGCSVDDIVNTTALTICQIK